MGLCRTSIDRLLAQTFPDLFRLALKLAMMALTYPGSVLQDPGSTEQLLRHYLYFPTGPDSLTRSVIRPVNTRNPPNHTETNGDADDNEYGDSSCHGGRLSVPRHQTAPQNPEAPQ